MSNSEDFATLPPSYDDVVAAGSSMLVRGTSNSRIVPIALTPPVVPLPTVTEQTTSRTNSRQVSSSMLPSPVRGGGRGNTRTPQSSSNQPRQSARTSTQHQRHPLPAASVRIHAQQQEVSFIEQIAYFSMPNIMLTGLTIPKIDVDLDTEAHLPNRRKAVKQARLIIRLRNSCGCFWFFGFILLFLLIAIPVAMLLTALFGMNDCPYNGNILVVALAVLGTLLTASVVLRLCTSALSCCKIANFGGAARSKAFSTFIFIMEIVFFVSLVIVLLAMFLVTWYVFAVSPKEDPASEFDKEYCKKSFRTAATAFISSNLALSVLLVLYLSVLSVFYVLFRDHLNVASQARKSDSSSAARRQRGGGGYVERPF